jgi:hypothetical protein
MAEVVSFEVDINAGDSPKTFKDLTDKVQKLKQELEGSDLGSKNFKRLSAELQNAQSQVKNLEKNFEGLETEKVVESFAKVGEGIAGGFAAATGAMALFGEENESLNEAVVKTQAAVAIAMGARSVAEGLVQGKIALRVVTEKAGVVWTLAAAAAQKVFSLAMGTSTGAMKLFRMAMISTGIGALIVGVGLLIANFDLVTAKVKEVAASITSKFAWVRTFFETIGLMNTVEEDALDIAEQQMKKSEEVQKVKQREIELAKAQGKSAKELRDLEIKMIAERFEAYRVFVASKIKAGKEVTQEEKDQLDTLRHELNMARVKDNEDTKKEIEDKAKLEREKWEKIRAERKKAEEQEESDRKKRVEEIIKVNQQAIDIRISLIKDERERELETEREALKRKLEALKVNSEEEANLRLLLIEQSKQQEAEIERKYADEKAVRVAEEIQKKHDDDLVKAEADKVAKEKELADIQERINAQQEYVEVRIGLAQNLVNATSALGSLVIKDQQKLEKFNKGIALAQLAIDTAKAISSTIAGATAAAAAGGPAAPFLLAGYITSGIATVLSAVGTAKKLLGKSETTPAPSLSTSTPNKAPTITTGRPSVDGFNPTNRTSFDNPSTSLNIKTYVTETDITNSQDRIKKIKSQSEF